MSGAAEPHLARKFDRVRDCERRYERDSQDREYRESHHRDAPTGVNRDINFASPAMGPTKGFIFPP